MSAALVERQVWRPDPAHARRARIRRGAIVTAIIGIVALALFILTIAVGSTYVSPVEVLRSLVSPGGDARVDFVVRELRLPLAVSALAVGLALGLAGPLFQRLLGNPLASPDFVGVSSGASVFAAATIIVFHGSGIQVSLAALAGAGVTSFLIYLLAWRSGINGFRFILIGVGVTEFMISINGYILTRAQIWDARSAMSWIVGSVGNAGIPEIIALVCVLVVAFPIAIILMRPLHALELGDQPAAALGVRVEWARVALILVAIVLVGFATAAAGPIPFVALMAGPIAARLLGSSAGGIVAAGLIGAVIVLTADLVANHVMPTPLPTGVVTGLIGGPYLIWLLIRVNKEGRGG